MDVGETIHSGSVRRLCKRGRTVKVASDPPKLDYRGEREFLCAGHVWPLGDERLLDNLMEVKS